MRWSPTVAMLLLFPAAVVCCSPSHATQSTSPRPAVAPRTPTDDEAVLNAALLSFFQKSTWHRPEWDEGDFVVLAASWIPPRDGDGEGRVRDLKPLLDALLKSNQALLLRLKPEDDAEQIDDLNKSLPKVRQLRDLAKAGDFKIGAPAPLNALVLDRRILLEDKLRPERSRYGWSDGESRIIVQSGKEVTVRVRARLSPPTYSLDGRLALLTLLVPWSIHSATLNFYLQRVGSKWEVAHVEAIYYF